MNVVEIIIEFHVILKILATVLLVMVLAGPQVLMKAHITLSSMIRMTG